MLTDSAERKGTALKPEIEAHAVLARASRDLRADSRNYESPSSSWVVTAGVS